MSNRDTVFTSYKATYCENCGQLFAATDSIKESISEPVHRVDILEAIADVEEVGETVAVEERECECTGSVVSRYYCYPAKDVPEPDIEPDEDEFIGRDPDEDALIDLDPEGDGDWQEVKEVFAMEVSDE